MRSATVAIRPIVLQLAVVTLLMAFAGCGGGGGGGAPSGSRLSGTVTKPATPKSAAKPGRAISGTALAGATVSAYAFPDLIDTVATATTDSDGRYTLSLPAAVVGKDIVVVAELAEGGGTTTREATVVPGLKSGDTLADVDVSTTLATEAIVKAADSANPPVTDLASASVATVMSAFARWSGLSGVSCDVPGNANLPDTLGGGLKPAGAAGQFADSNLADALSHVGASTDANVATAKGIVQWLRDDVNTIVSAGQNAKGSLKQTLEAERDALTSEVTTVSYFQKSSSFVVRVLGVARHDGDDTLEGKAPARYSFAYDSGEGRNVLTQTGTTTDGSWVVVSALTNGSAPTTLTIKPQSPIPAFDPTDAAAGKFTLAASNGDHPTFSMSGTFTLSANNSGQITGAGLNLTVSDSSALTKSVTFTGTVTQGSASSTQVSYSFNGSFSSQWGTASSNGSVTLTGSAGSYDVQSMQLASLSANTTLSEKAALTVTNASVSFADADPAHNIYERTPSRIAADTIAITLTTSGGSTYRLALTGANATFDRYAVSNYSVWHTSIVPTSVTGTAQYTAPDLTLNGSVSGTWTNATSDFVYGSSNYADFPVASVHVTGKVVPAVGEPATVDLTLSSSNANVGGTVQENLTVGAVSSSGQSLNGSLTTSYPINGNGTVADTPTTSGTITHSPSGFVVVLSNDGHNTTGAIYTSSSKTTKVGDIGRASDLGLPDLGGAMIIRYTDGSFETVASILP